MTCTLTETLHGLLLHSFTSTRMSQCTDYRIPMHGLPHVILLLSSLLLHMHVGFLYSCHMDPRSCYMYYCSMLLYSCSMIVSRYWYCYSRYWIHELLIWDEWHPTSIVSCFPVIMLPCTVLVLDILCSSYLSSGTPVIAQSRQRPAEHVWN